MAPVIPDEDIAAVLAMPSALKRAAALAALIEDAADEAVATDAWTRLSDRLHDEALGETA